jgi:hypothetical protein
MAINDTKGHQKMPVANSHSVGPQGTGGAKSGGKVYGVNLPRGQEPKSQGGGMGGLVQDPIQPKVGK